MTSEKKTITVAHGDGIGPEIMNATLRILDAANANLEYETIEIGKNIYEQGIASGMKPESWEPIRRNKIFLKAPITTPQGGGVKSLNVTMRKTLGLFANVRPCTAFAPYVQTKHPDMDVTIIRENEEDTYGGIEHRQTYEVHQCLKLITLPGTERIIRYAFEYARTNNRSKVTCFTKDNIMKLTDGLFHDVFKQIAEEYPNIEAENMIVDIGAARLADTPENFDVVVMPNLYGDIVSDITAQISGSVGLVGSANIGVECAMFEAIHGSAPDIAGQNIANPSGLLRGALMMLVHIGKANVANNIHNALMTTLEDGIHTPDIYGSGHSQEKVSTEEFTDAVIDRLGQVPSTLPKANYPEESPEVNVDLKLSRGASQPSRNGTRTLTGTDVFVYWEPGAPSKLAKMLQQGAGDDFELTMITNRGTKVWPEGMEETFCTDHWRCRFLGTNGSVDQKAVIDLLGRLSNNNIDIIKTENLYEFDGKRAYSLGQGE